MNLILEFDRALFELINGQWTSPLYDQFFPAITDLHRSPIFLMVAGLLLLLWISQKKVIALKWIFILALAVGLSDLVCYRVVKPLVHRDRPEVAGVQVQLRSQNHSGLSFPSNHAANVFAAATILTYAIGFPWGFLFFAVASLVAYSRVYVGVHFPLDVIGGAFIGLVIGVILQKLFWSWLQPAQPKETPARYKGGFRNAGGASHGRSSGPSSSRGVGRRGN